MEKESVKNGKENSYLSFLILYSGQVISLFGSSITNFVIIWWIAISSESIFYLTLAALCGMLPGIVLSPMIGVWIDRLNNNKLIMLLADFFQAVLTVVLILSFYSGLADIYLILIILLLKSTFQSFHTPTFFTVIPMMVPKDKLSRTNSLMSLSNSLVGIVAPILAASLLVYYQIADIIWIDLITFLMAAFPLILIYVPKVETSEIESENSVKKSVFTEIKEGILYLNNQNGLIPLLLSFAMVNATLVPTGGYLVLLIENFHLGTSQDYAYVLTASNIGILLASLIFTRIKIDNVIRGLVVGIIIIFAGPIIIGFTPKGEFGLIMIANFITGFAVIVASISSSTLWQKTVPFEFQGRVNSLRMTFATMAQPLGMILGGFIADSLGLPEMYLIFGVLGLIIFLLFVIFSNIRFIGKDEQQTVNKISQDQIFAQNTAS